MSLRQKIIGAAARWAGSSAAPQWARQAACGFHSTGAASAAAGAPGASPRGLLLSSPTCHAPMIEASPVVLVLRRRPRRVWLRVSVRSFYTRVFCATASFPRRDVRWIARARSCQPPFRRKYLAPPSDLKFDLFRDRQERLHHHRPRVRCRRRRCGWCGSSRRHRPVRARSQDGVHHQALPHTFAHGSRARWHQRRSR